MRFLKRRPKADNTSAPKELPNFPLLSREKIDTIQPSSTIKQENSNKSPFPDFKFPKGLKPSSTKQDSSMSLNTESMSEGFFLELLDKVNQEAGDIHKVEELYRKNLLPENLLESMKSYYQQKSPTAILGRKGKEVKEKIIQEMNDLQRVEKEWQQAYLQLTEKEAEIQEREADLKKMIEEFSTLCKGYIDKRNIDSSKTK